jgi:hypothetical protein
VDENAVLTSGGDILGTAKSVLSSYFDYRILDKRIDAEAARPFQVNDPTLGAFFIGSNGQMYKSANSATPGIVSSLGPLLVLGGLALIGWAVFKAAR